MPSQALHGHQDARAVYLTRQGHGGDGLNALEETAEEKGHSSHPSSHKVQ